MQLRVRFWSYFTEITGTAECVIEAPEEATVSQAMEIVEQQFPKLAPLRRSTLHAIGCEYALPTQVLKPGDELSLFPPVQGG